MTRYLLYKLKGLATSRSILLWGLLLMLFWAFMWVFVFTRVEDSPPEEVLKSEVKVGAALGYVYLGVLSVSSVTIGLANHTLISSGAVVFATRFTKLSRSRYLLEDFAASLVCILIYEVAVIGAVVGLYFARFRILAPPENPLALLAYLVLAGVESYWIGQLLGVALLRARKALMSVLNFLPLLLGFSVYATLWLDPGDLVYALPLAPLASLAVSAASGVKAVRGSWFGGWLWGYGEAPPELNHALALGSTVAWIVALALASLVLMKRVAGVKVEEVVRVTG